MVVGALATAGIAAIALLSTGNGATDRKQQASPTTAPRPAPSTVPNSQIPTSSLPPAAIPGPEDLGVTAAGRDLRGADIARGQSVELTAAGFRASSPVIITLRSEPLVLGVADSDATGAIRLSVDIPADTEIGFHTIEVSGTAADGAPRVVSGTFTVVDALPNTGTRHPRASTVVALTLMAFGFALVRLARPRRHGLL